MDLFNTILEYAEELSVYECIINRRSSNDSFYWTKKLLWFAPWRLKRIFIELKERNKI